jgi:hypothetical protein
MANSNSNSNATRTYLLREDSGAEKIIQADSLENAAEQAREWVEGGEYDGEETDAEFSTKCRIYAGGSPAPGTPADEIVTVRFRVIDGAVETI